MGGYLNKYKLNLEISWRYWISRPKSYLTG